MQINSIVNQAINKQIGVELGAYLQYLTISTYFDVEGLSELAAFFKAQAEDERDHAERFINHVVAFNGKLQNPCHRGTAQHSVLRRGGGQVVARLGDESDRGDQRPHEAGLLRG